MAAKPSLYSLLLKDVVQQVRKTTHGSIALAVYLLRDNIWMLMCLEDDSRSRGRK
jgi:hypothetical protein